jgi:hypothetical protein
MDRKPPPQCRGDALEVIRVARYDEIAAVERADYDAGVDHVTCPRATTRPSSQARRSFVERVDATASQETG